MTMNPHPDNRDPLNQLYSTKRGSCAYCHSKPYLSIRMVIYGQQTVNVCVSCIESFNHCSICFHAIDHLHQRAVWVRHHPTAHGSIIEKFGMEIAHISCATHLHKHYDVLFNVGE